MLTRIEYEKEEAQRLAPYAIKSSQSQGRRYPEPEHAMRTCFQRDRDRIIHSVAFRRLEYKTQVYITHEGDYYRTRLTHTLEVSQIARTAARLLLLNEELTEAIALGHDLGHTPFGHAGEDVLQELMKEHGGFEHNRQGLRIVDFLEQKYSHFPGLNLTYEVREGILKHAVFDEENRDPKIAPRKQPTLECQIVDISDSIAYNTHDLDDALEQGLIRPEDLDEVELWRENYQAVKQQTPDILWDYAKFETMKGIINQQVFDLVTQTEKNIAENKVQSAEEIRRHSHLTGTFSPQMRQKNALLKSFLYKNVYQHRRVAKRNEKAYQILTGLFQKYLTNRELLPETVQAKFTQEDPYRVISDYIASMTDRFAQVEYNKLFKSRSS